MGSFCRLLTLVLSDTEEQQEEAITCRGFEVLTICPTEDPSFLHC